MRPAKLCACALMTVITVTATVKRIFFILSHFFVDTSFFDKRSGRAERLTPRVLACHIGGKDTKYF